MMSSTCREVSMSITQADGSMPIPSAPRSTLSLDSTSRKRQQNTPQKHVVAQPSKRVRLMGRPKNNWTLTRKRKLVRLYLMTELDVEEIAEVLRGKGFQPCKRDIQKQLNILLQTRPNLIRVKGHITKERLRLLRECKDLRASRKLKPGTVLRQDCDVFPSVSPSSLTSTCVFPMSLENGQRSDQPLWSEFVNLDSLESLPGSPRASSTGGSTTDLPQKTTAHLTSTASAHIPIPFIRPGIHDSSFPLELHRCPAVVPDPDLEYAITGDKSKFSSDSDSRNGLRVRDDQSVFSTGGKSGRSTFSITSLKRRLQSKYSSSFLGDIQSLMGRLSISSCSDVSSLKSRRHVSSSRYQVSTSTKSEQPVILPGVFPQYCWEHITHSELVCCDDIRLPCNRGPLFSISGEGTHDSVSADVLFRIRTGTVLVDDLTAVDSFRNSVLHIAAALGSSLGYLSTLIALGANVNCLNNANQTFLHLITLSDIGQLGEFDYLLWTLVQSTFKFQQQDHNGKTVLHALTEAQGPWKILSSIIHSFQRYNIELPSCRNNLGKTVAHQLQEKGFSLLSPSCQQQDPIFFYDSILQQHIPVDIKPFQIDRSMANDSSPRSFTSLQHDRDYELHASLLRTIVRAGDDPLCEDTEGRNGLHCLAEVHLDLPIEQHEDTVKSPFEQAPARRERYLAQLLSNGVDPNGYDSNGLTAFMAFIIYTREEEDDALTTKLLGRLVKAGADVNTRNRRGEIALHIAVKLGRRAATKFLLSHEANIHARTSKGLGILALGLKYSDRAVHDAVLYAQISLCICLVGSAGAVPAPTILDEWASPEFRITSVHTSRRAQPIPTSGGIEETDWGHEI